LDKEAEYTKQGDHLEAGQYLDDARIKITLITDQLKVIEPLQHSLSNVYPGQIEEINQTYQKLLNQKFKFTEDVATLIKEVQDNMLKAGDALGELNFDNVNSISEDIGSEIDHLYDLLGKEIEAKQGVLKQQKPVLDYINHARFQHNRLDIRVQDLEEHYILKKDDLDLIKKNLNSLNRLREDYDQDVQDIADKEVIFSKAEQNFQKAIIELDKIEKSEKDVNDNFNQMITSEGIAKNSVDEYAKKLEIQKKMVEQLRLNGLPDDYLDYFYMVYDEIRNFMMNWIPNVSIWKRSVSK
jgi:Negative regulator of septation ring formation